MTAPAPNPKDAPDVVVHPPVLFAVLLAAGLVLQHFRPLFVPHPWPWRESWPGGDTVVIAVAGWGAIILGLVYALAAVTRFRRAGTHIPTFHAATALVTEGIYGFTRNPMYAGGIMIYAGIAVLRENIWLMIGLPVLVAVLRWGVVAREEAYMEAKFGQPYRDYLARVRRRF